MSAATIVLSLLGLLALAVVLAAIFGPFPVGDELHNDNDFD